MKCPKCISYVYGGVDVNLFKKEHLLTYGLKALGRITLYTCGECGLTFAVQKEV